ncbi:MAG: hypothetical protein WBM41_04195 [Arenicellales bacterium]
MTVSLFFKSLSMWVIIALCAIANGVFRENILAPVLGKTLALPMSGLSLSIAIFIVTNLSFSLINGNDKLTYILIGLQWVLLTLFFEFVFGHYVVGKSWTSIFEVFNIVKGDLFLVVLVIILVSPLLVAMIKGELK